jgi:tetratricopeptide (TPR) repeat protein
MQFPLYVDGRILADNGQPLAQAVSVALNCGMRRLQAVRTDVRGYFQFALGGGAQNNMDFSAVDATMGSASAGFGMESLNVPGPMGGFSATGGRNLTGCELRISVPGYHPLSHVITDPASLGSIEIGTLELRRIASESEGGSISATSLLAPANARREYDRGIQDAHNNNLRSAAQRLEKAVAEYDKYASAWYELGRVYTAGQQGEKARQAYEKAIAADPHFAPPYASLAAFDLQEGNYEKSLESVDKALQLDPGMRIGMVSYIQAAANYRLNRLDAAEQSALEAEKGPHQNMPQLHGILTDIYLRRGDNARAAAQIRAYLKEFPQGTLATELKQHLARIEKLPEMASAQPDVAP